MSADSFGPTALATPANAVTIGRVVLTPILLVILLDAGASWPGIVLWFGLSASDGVDGFLARRHGTTRSGAFLDPLADKFLVLGALAALAGKGVFSWWPVVLVGAREVAMSAYRMVAGRHGVSVPARRSAKLKTVCQELAVGAAVLPPTADHLPDLATVLLWVAVVLTLWTGAQYLRDARGDFDAL
ncbi:MAG: CDP-alcohol phosphatidyltransferase family protein [Acidobacteria bacterium]|nr:CDP-alcohol phosphatidyltransferase family protein [Acidobacteriota bacterium]